MSSSTSTDTCPHCGCPHEDYGAEFKAEDLRDAIAKAQLGRLPTSCPRCHNAAIGEPTAAFINYNPGDEVITPHIHLNLVFYCDDCEKQFAVRGRLAPGDLYYGNIQNGVQDAGFRPAEWVGSPAIYKERVFA